MQLAFTPLVRRTASLAVVIACVPLVASTRSVWGEAGHRITAQAATASLPDSMPAFFRNASAQLVYLNPEPDRWKSRLEADSALGTASSADHYVDTEMIPPDRRPGAFAAATRNAYADTLRAIGANAEKVGFLPFRILELTQSLRVEFRLWRNAPNAQVREWIEARIINDAGILGHYVADGSNPAHTTIHHNGWIGANPNGYATDNRFHSRFEGAFVQSQVKIGDVQPLVQAPPRVHRDLRAGIQSYLNDSFREVEHLYQLDKTMPFGAANTSGEHKAFAATRLAAGAQMLRDLWWTAWITSADATPR